LSASGLAARLTRGALALALLALGACGAADETAPPPAAPAEPDAALVLRRPATPPPAPRLAPPELCSVLTRILADHPRGFAGLRAGPVAHDRWQGRAVLPGAERCTIEGAAWPRARYVCASGPFAADNRDGADARFEALVSELDQCLSKPIWFPRAWQRGEAFEFARGERLQAWTDQSTAPPSQVVLKMQQELDRSGYGLELSLETSP
jgi:hypothetical protein